MPAFVPKAWENLPSTATPLDAAALADLETRVTAYSDTSGAANFVHQDGTGMPGTVAQNVGTDPYGRANLLKTLNGTVSLPHYVTVEDFDQGLGPGNGDAGRVADGVMSSGSNALTSSATVNLRVNHRVEVTNVKGQTFTGTTAGTTTVVGVSSFTNLYVNDPITGADIPSGTTITALNSGAGTLTLSQAATGGGIIGGTLNSCYGNISGWVSSTAGGHATLVTTKGGSTPLNATFSSSLAVAAGFIVYVTYGSTENDSGSWQAAQNALENKGGGTLGVYPWKTYLLSKVLPGSLGKGNVTFTGSFGAKTTIFIDPALDGSVGGQAAFYYRPSFSIGPAGATHLMFERLSFEGHGYEVLGQIPIFVFESNDLTVTQCDFTNLQSAGLQTQDEARLRVLHCTFNSVTTGANSADRIAGGYNALNMSSALQGNATPYTGFLIDGNTFLDCRSENIAMVTDVTSASTTELAGRVINNYIYSVIKGAGIFFEGGSAAVPAKHMIIANNLVTMNPTSGATGIIVDDDSAAPSPDGQLCRRYLIMGNSVDASTGLITEGSFFAIVGNVIRASQYAIQAEGTSGNWICTGTFTNGSANVTGITFPVAFTYHTPVSGVPDNRLVLDGGSNPTNVRAGTALTGPGIPISSTVIGMNTSTATGSVILSAPVTLATPNLTTSINAAGGARTTLSVSALPYALASASLVALATSGLTQNWTLTSPAAPGDTVLHVASQTPNGTYPINSTCGVAITGSTQPFAAIQRGSHIANQAGVPAGTYIIDGSSDQVTTWTLSQPYSGGGGLLTFQVQTPSYGVIVANNVCDMDANFASFGIRLGGLQRSLCQGNEIHTGPGTSGGTTGVGILINFSSFCDVMNNRIDNAPTHGIQANTANNLTFINNKIKNCSSAGVSQGNGLSLLVLGGTANVFQSNTIVDDRAIHQMTSCVGGTPNASNFINNTMLGSVPANAPVTTTTGIRVWRNNDIDQPGWSFLAQSGAPIQGGGAGVPNEWFYNSSPFVKQLTISGGTNSAVGLMRGSNGTTNALLSVGGAITSLPCAALRDPIPDATVLTLYGVSAGVLQTQTWTVSNGGVPVPAGSTSIPVASQTPNFAYPSGCLFSSAAVQNMGAPLGTAIFSFPMMPGDAIQLTSTVVPGNTKQTPILF